MCGIAGILNAPGRSLPEGAINRMVERIAHRGPDSSAVFTDESCGLALGHQRLAIVDLSPNGAQPMRSASGRYIIVLNGEIYNFQQIRSRLEAEGVEEWRGHSDTEVLLQSIERWGVEQTLILSEGMFAFALWDFKTRELTIARDRLGEKPLFVGRTKDGLAFASQLSSVLAYPAIDKLTDRRAMELFLALSYIPEPHTPFSNVWKLPPGCFAIIKPGDVEIHPKPYWNAIDAACAARRASIREKRSPGEVISAIEKRLTEVVSNQMIADVPLGAFLSGGLDSSLVVALMRQVATRPVQTFTIGFEDQRYDESPYANAVARHLGTDHTAIMFHPDQARDMLTKMPEIYDEPFADSSQLPTYLVSLSARKSVTVALTGDGGDEIFGGYNRHRIAAQYGKLIDTLPTPARRGMGQLLSAAGRSPIARMVEHSGITGKIRLIGEKLVKLGDFLASRDTLGMYESLIRRDNGLVPGSAISEQVQSQFGQLKSEGLSTAEIMMLLDTTGYMPGDPLTKVDRASMAVALETRTPYLDHQLYALSWSLPIEERIKNGQTKHVIRSILAKHVPNTLFERPKAGFGVPISSWLAGPLRPWVAERLDAFAHAHPELAEPVRIADARFMSGDPAIHHLIWNFCMWQSWESHYG